MRKMMFLIAVAALLRSCNINHTSKNTSDANAKANGLEQTETNLSDETDAPVDSTYCKVCKHLTFIPPSLATTPPT